MMMAGLFVPSDGHDVDNLDEGFDDGEEGDRGDGGDHGDPVGNVDGGNGGDRVDDDGVVEYDDRGDCTDENCGEYDGDDVGETSDHDDDHDYDSDDGDVGVEGDGRRVDSGDDNDLGDYRDCCDDCGVGCIACRMSNVSLAPLLGEGWVLTDTITFERYETSGSALELSVDEDTWSQVWCLCVCHVDLECALTRSPFAVILCSPRYSGWWLGLCLQLHASIGTWV